MPTGAKSLELKCPAISASAWVGDARHTVYVDVRNPKLESFPYRFKLLFGGMETPGGLLALTRGGTIAPGATVRLEFPIDLFATTDLYQLAPNQARTFTLTLQSLDYDTGALLTQVDIGQAVVTMPWVTLYEHISWGGQWQNFGLGKHSLAGNYLDKKASGVAVMAGVTKVILYTSYDCVPIVVWGFEQRWEINHPYQLQPDLRTAYVYYRQTDVWGTVNINDVISSIEVVRV